jgi:hypothetical protein
MSAVLARSRVSGVWRVYNMIGEVQSQAEQLVMKGKKCQMTPGVYQHRPGPKGSPWRQRDKEDMKERRGLATTHVVPLYTPLP